MSVKALQEYTLRAKYARYNKQKQRRETYEEATNRVRDMMLEQFPQVADYINWAYDKAVEQKCLGSQRALQFGGKPAIQHNARIYNCLHRSTQFITSQGVKSFNDFQNGDSTVVLTQQGRWKSAVVRKFGVDDLYPITFQTRFNNPQHVVWATKDHRWLLNDGTETTSLQVGDLLCGAPNIFGEFDYYSATPDERLWWAYGFVFGDGTLIKDDDGEHRYSMVRLCGEDKSYRERFEELGFVTSSPKSYDGDIVAYTGHYLKQAPDPTKEEPRHIRAFVRGYLDADGGKNSNPGHISPFSYIQATGKKHIDFIRAAFPVAGIYIHSEKDLTGQVTNFGVRPHTIRFTIANKYNKNFTYRVTSIGEISSREEVWCLEVEDDHSFILPNGIPTGNCTSSYCDRLRFFQEALYLLLCGCGTGFSVQSHHIAKLPPFQETRINGLMRPKKVFVIPDSIEGWSDALGVLLSSYFSLPVFPGYANWDVEFDYSHIRPEGSYLSSGAGKAPGPKPLKRSLEKIRDLLNHCVAVGQTRLRPIDAYDVVMHASDAVLAGGIRRSATICIFSVDDMEMLTAKTGNWFAENPQRGRSNNSALLVRGKTSKQEFKELIKHVRQWGEPGFYWSDSTEHLPNPCQPAWAKVLTPDGIRTFGEIDEGSTIWGPEGWTKVIKKWSTGTNKVYRYETTAGIFYGTSQHRVISGGIKTPVEYAESIDILAGPYEALTKFNQQLVVDGLVLGDGTVHEASNRKVLLLIGNNDQDYFDDDVSSYIGKKHSSSPCAYDVTTNITAEELPLTTMRRVPERYLRGGRNEVCSFLKGIFSANGSVCGQRITLKSSSKRLIEDIQIMLSSVGIKSYYTTNPTKTVIFENGPYECKENYDLNITTDREKFQQSIGFIQAYKCNKMDKMIVSISKKVPSKITYDIVSVTEVSEEETFDITVDNQTHTYWTQCMQVSNCVEIGFWPRLLLKRPAPSTQELLDTYQGPIDNVENDNILVSGWQFCNLSTINGAVVETEEDFYEGCEAAAIIGSLQASFTSFPYLGPVTELIVRREALLGVSITGVMDCPHIILQPYVLRQGADRVKEINAKLAPKLGINLSARSTCLKPEGTGSLVLGTLATGCHLWHAKQVLRRIQANINEPVYKLFKKHNPWACEKSRWCQNGTTDVITFCVKAPEKALIKEGVTAVDFLSIVKLIQENWVVPGTRPELCTQPGLTHNVSNTVQVKETEWDEVVDFIYNNRASFAGISLIPGTGDKDYAQAPFVAVYNPEEIAATYGEASTRYAVLLLMHGLDVHSNDLWTACDKLLGDGPKDDWMRQCITFADSYFDGDIRVLTYLFKDLYNLHIWNYLQERYVNVDYDMLIEEEDNTRPQEELSCVGGACAI